MRDKRENRKRRRTWNNVVNLVLITLIVGGIGYPMVTMYRRDSRDLHERAQFKKTLQQQQRTLKDMGTQQRKLQEQMKELRQRVPADLQEKIDKLNRLLSQDPVRPTPKLAGLPSRGGWRVARASNFGIGDGLLGHAMANGQPLTDSVLGFANRNLPMGTKVVFEYRGRMIVATKTDWGPASWTNREFDLTPATQRALQYVTDAPLNWKIATDG